MPFKIPWTGRSGLPRGYTPRGGIGKGGAYCDAPPVTFLIAALALLAFGSVEAKTLHPDMPFIRGHVGEYDEWRVGCDNQANCTMMGIPPNSRDSDAGLPNIDGMIVRIELAADSSAPPKVELIPLGNSNTGDQFYLVAWDQLGRVSPFHDYARLTLDSTEAIMLIDQMLSGGHIYGHAAKDGTERIRFPGPGLARAYKVVTRKQANLREELKQEKAFTTYSATELMLPSVTSLYTQRAGCHFPGEGVFLRRYALADGDELWRLQCSAADNAPSYWYQSGEDDIGKPLMLPDPRDGSLAVGEAGLPNAEFDFDMGVLRSYSQPRDKQDCGTFRAWGYTDAGWQLLERREMPDCVGLSPVDWIRTYHVDAIIGLSDDE